MIFGEEDIFGEEIQNDGVNLEYVFQDKDSNELGRILLKKNKIEKK